MKGTETIKRARISIERQNNESPMSLLKRFNRAVTTSAILRQARALRYASRPTTNLQEKKRALRRIELYKEKVKLAKQGKTLKK